MMNELVLEQHLRLHLDKARSPVTLPGHLFRRFPRSREITFEDDSAPIPIVKAMFRLLQVDVNGAEGYPLRSAVQRKHIPLVKLLLDAGADPLMGPSCKESATFLAARTGSLELLKLMLKASHRSCKEDNLKLDTELLKAAYDRKAYDIVMYLTKERGAVPTIEILQWIAEKDDRPKRKRREGTEVVVAKCCNLT